MPRCVSYWLVPSVGTRVFFQDLIETLAHSHQAPTFVPHVTIYSGDSSATENPVSIICESMQGVREVRLQIDSIMFSELFTKTLFVQFHQSEILTRINADIRRLSTRQSGYKLNPHLSLLYKHMPAREKEKLSSSLRLPMSEVSFDAVWAIASPGSPLQAEDIEGWQVICGKNFREMS